MDPSLPLGTSEKIGPFLTRELFLLRGRLFGGQGLLGRNFFPVLVDVVDVKRAVCRIEHGATRDAGELMLMLAWQINVVTGSNRGRRSIFHLELASAADHHEVLAGGMPMPRHCATRCEFSQNDRGTF